MHKNYESLVPIYEMEVACSAIISKELDSCFEFAKKAAYSYSLMVSKDIKSADIESFKSLVLSEQDIERAVDKILFHINNEIEEYAGSSDICDSYIYTAKYAEDIDIIKNTLAECGRLQVCNDITGRVLNSVIDEIIKRILPGFFADFFIKRLNLKDYLLGSNSPKKQSELYAQQIYAQIQGMLINIKTALRNEITETILSALPELMGNIKIA